VSIRSFLHRRLKIGGHRWLATVQESICDPLDGGREISYRAIRKCALCGCLEKDWRIVGSSEDAAPKPAIRRQTAVGDWRLSLVGLVLKPFALVIFLVLLMHSGWQGLRVLLRVA